ncbi:MAG: hypothetical protein MHM6MM_001614 [Cercozoa sp. M6MM]
MSALASALVAQEQSRAVQQSRGSVPRLSLRRSRSQVDSVSHEAPPSFTSSARVSATSTRPSASAASSSANVRMPPKSQHKQLLKKVKAHSHRPSSKLAISLAKSDWQSDDTSMEPGPPVEAADDDDDEHQFVAHSLPTTKSPPFATMARSPVHTSRKALPMEVEIAHDDFMLQLPRRRVQRESVWQSEQRITSEIDLYARKQWQDVAEHHARRKSHHRRVVSNEKLPLESLQKDVLDAYLSREEIKRLDTQSVLEHGSYSNAMRGHLENATLQTQHGLYLTKRLRSFFEAYAKLQKDFHAEVKKLVDFEVAKLDAKLKGMPSKTYVSTSWRCVDEIFRCCEQSARVHHDTAEQLELLVVHPLANFYQAAAEQRKTLMRREQTLVKQMQTLETKVNKRRAKAEKLLDALLQTPVHEEEVLSGDESDLEVKRGVFRKLWHRIKREESEEEKENGVVEEVDGRVSVRLPNDVDTEEAVALQAPASARDNPLVAESEEERLLQILSRHTSHMRRQTRTACVAYEAAVQDGRARQDEFYRQQLPDLLSRMRALEEMRVRCMRSHLEKFVSLQDNLVASCTEQHHGILEVAAQLRLDIPAPKRSLPRTSALEYQLEYTPDDLKNFVRQMRQRLPFSAALQEYASRPEEELDIDLPRPKFADLREHKHVLTAFHAFLRRSLCAENLVFWKDVDLYKRQTEFSSPHARRRAAKIYANYVDRNARLHVNLPASVLDDIDLKISQWTELSEQQRECLFDTALREIEKLMQSDSMPKFLKSQEYRDVLRTSHAPQRLSPMSRE